MMRLGGPVLRCIAMRALLLFILLQKPKLVCGDSMKLRIINVAAQSVHSGEYRPENVIDNDMTTTFLSIYDDLPKWLKLTLPDGSHVEKVAIISYW